jgi:acetylornithine deacetylase/succinyl-diaminopimelate desuccinylase-like protein
VEFWTAVTEFCAVRDEARGAERPFDRLLPALQEFNSEDDGTHGVVTLTVGFRLAPDDDPSELQKELASLVTECVGQSSGTDLQLRFAGAEPAHKASKSTPLVRAFLASIRYVRAIDVLGRVLARLMG